MQSVQQASVSVVELPAEGAGLEERLRAAAEIDQACRTVGFFAVVGHGVSTELQTNATNAVRTFFDLPVETKSLVAMPYQGYPYGYCRVGGEALSKSTGETSPCDLKETFSIGPRQHPAATRPPPDAAPEAPEEAAARAFVYSATQWPASPPELRGALEAYYAAMETLAARLMRLMALALQLPEAHFDATLDRHISALRAVNYPEVNHTCVDPGQLRAGAHSDYGSLTILLGEDRPGGLEICLPARGEWVRVPAVPGGFVVNVGDLLARWTNDRWVSTLHRVGLPPAAAPPPTRRQSLVFFHQPNWDANISCLPTCAADGIPAKYPPTTSGRHLMEKFQSTQ